MTAGDQAWIEKSALKPFSPDASVAMSWRGKRTCPCKFIFYCWCLMLLMMELLQRQDRYSDHFLLKQILRAIGPLQDGARFLAHFTCSCCHASRENGKRKDEHGPQCQKIPAEPSRIRQSRWQGLSKVIYHPQGLDQWCQEKPPVLIIMLSCTPAWCIHCLSAISTLLSCLGAQSVHCPVHATVLALGG